MYVHIKAATDPKDWIPDPAGLDPDSDPDLDTDPDPLTQGTLFQLSQIPKNVYF